MKPSDAFSHQAFDQRLSAADFQLRWMHMALKKVFEMQGANLHESPKYLPQ
jgi:hypothetical protein